MAGLKHFNVLTDLTG